MWVSNTKGEGQDTERALEYCPYKERKMYKLVR